MAIHTAAGPELDASCQKLGLLNQGEIAVTGGYKLPCTYIIHTMGPPWKGGGKNEVALLRSCYINALFKASELFDKIHYDAYLCERTTPATIEDFIEYGLQPEDYARYVGLQQRLQSELILYGHPKSSIILPPGREAQPTYPALEELISFCEEKKLVTSDDRFRDSFYYHSLLERSDAEYYHGWLQYPKEASDFRLTVERKLSTWWNEEDAYITETFGSISFDYDDYTEHPDGSHWVKFDSPVRIKRYDPDTKKYTILKNSEVRKLFELAQKEKYIVEKEIAAHLAQIPSEHDVVAASAGLPWTKKMYKLYDRQEIIESVYERMSEAVSTPDIYKFKDSDVLFVFCGSDTCQEAGHLLSDIRVEFSFYCKPDKQYTIKRCAHCMRFRIPLHDLAAMFERYGVPRGRIVYDIDTNSDFSGFAETSIFYDMGYTVSQSVNLTAAKRQSILKHAIDTGKASKYEVLGFLKQRMNINGMKSGNEIAFQKWKEDYEYIYQL